jgi:predicted nucleic-acid-binding protein
MKISVDANVLARAVLNDDPTQSRAARKLLKEASLIAVPLPCLCELVWVLRQGAKLSKDHVATVVRSLMNAGNVVVNRPAAELGLAVLEAGGDFADGAIAYEGAWLGRRNIRVLRQECRRPPVQAGRSRAALELKGRNWRSEAVAAKHSRVAWYTQLFTEATHPFLRGDLRVKWWHIRWLGFGVKPDMLVRLSFE